MRNAILSKASSHGVSLEGEVAQNLSRLNVA